DNKLSRLQWGRFLMLLQIMSDSTGYGHSPTQSATNVPPTGVLWRKKKLLNGEFSEPIGYWSAEGNAARSTVAKRCHSLKDGDLDNPSQKCAFGRSMVVPPPDVAVTDSERRSYWTMPGFYHDQGEI
ncbi:MAG: hypothetical protein Q9214_000206, partial [Letrouitia sp. 1 TL-2023]